MLAILIKKLYSYIELLKSNDNLIQDAIDTLENCYLIILENEDYSIGKIIECSLYYKYFNDERKIDFVGFLKKHPHDKNSFIKISFKEFTTKEQIIIILEHCINESILQRC